MFARLLEPQERVITPEKMWGPWYGDVYQTASGISVTRDSALQLMAVAGSVQLIVNEISTLPIEAGADWVDQPTPDLNTISWLSQIVSSMVLDGSSFVAVLPSGGQTSYLPLDAQKVTCGQENGRKVFRINGQLAPFEIVEIPCLMLAGADRGLSPLEYARQSIGLGIAAQKYGAEFFDMGPGNMPGVIEAKKPMEPGTKKELAELWRRKLSRGGRGLPGVLDDETTWKPTSVTNEQAQFLATRGFTAAEIAGQMFMVDPSELGIPVQGTSLTYANLAQRNTRRITFTCMPHIRRIERAFAPYARGAFRFNVDARLRGDTKESYETLKIALDGGFMTINEVRDILGLEPVADGVATASPREIAEMIQKIYLGVGVVITAEEARHIVSTAGADLPGDLPLSKEAANAPA